MGAESDEVARLREGISSSASLESGGGRGGGKAKLPRDLKATPSCAARFKEAFGVCVLIFIGGCSWFS